MANKANWYYSARENRWRITGKGGSNVAQFTDGGQARLPSLVISDTGEVTRLRGFVATLAAAISIASGNPIGVGTLQSATGSGVGCAGLNVGDMIFGSPKTVLSTAVIAGFHVPTTNTLNVYTSSRDPNGGSLAVIGFDIGQLRAS